MLACVFSLFSLFDFKMSLFSNDRKKTWTTIKVKRQWWMEIDCYDVSFRHSKKKNRFCSSDQRLLAIVEHYFGFFIQYDAGWFFSFHEKQFTKTMLRCVRLTWFGIIFSNYHAGVWLMPLLVLGRSLVICSCFCHFSLFSKWEHFLNWENHRF